MRSRGVRMGIDLFDDFLVRACLAGIGVACVSGPFGCFVVWRRMAYFGDTLAHAALLGVALGFLLSTEPTLSVIVVGIGVALMLVGLQEQRALSSDTLLGILAHAALALGVIAASLTPSLRSDLLGYLFGDILAVTVSDIAWIYAGGAIVLSALAAIWRPLVAVTVDADLAAAEGIPTRPVRLAFMVLIAVVIALAMKIVGVLLVTSLLIIPAATARRWARTPEHMAAIAAATGSVAVILGLAASLVLDIPSGPSVVVAAATLFFVGLLPIGGLCRRAGGP